MFDILGDLFGNPYLHRIAGIIFIIWVSKAIASLISDKIKELHGENKILNMKKIFRRVKPFLPLFVSLFVAILFLDMSQDIITVFVTYGKEVMTFTALSSYFYTVGKNSILDKRSEYE